MSDHRATLTIVNQLRFEEGLGSYSVNVAPEGVWILQGMGTHVLQFSWRSASRKSPRKRAAAGLETALCAPEGSGPRIPLAFADVSVPFNPDGEVRRPTLYYLITNAQLLALEQRRNGDLRLELQVNGILPQATSGFPGATQVTEYISIAESRWRQQLAGLGRTLGAEMLIPFPDDDEPRLHWLSHRTLPPLHLPYRSSAGRITAACQHPVNVCGQRTSAQGQTVITTTLCLTTAFPTQKIRHNGYQYYEVEYEWPMAPQVNPFRQISPNMACAYRERNERRERFPMMNFCDSQ